MHEYYHPSSDPTWVNDDWLKRNTQWDPDTTPVEVLADNGYFEVKTEDPGSSHSPYLYFYIWSGSVIYPYYVQIVSEFDPKPLPQAKAWMLKTYPDYAAEIEAATSVDELQQILNSIPQV